MTAAEWHLIGNIDELKRELESQGFLKELTIQERKFVLSYDNGEFAVLNNKCNHMGGPLAKGK
ncbi:Rieske (2Fe-2S) protein, partial [bacterium]|nr:Rieske (2Fe-2S) protein [bacterium]